MKIKNGTLNLTTLFDIEVGDIFLYEEHYYIAGEINWCDHYRECYDLTINLHRQFTVNHTVYAWDGRNCELVIR